MNLPKEPPYGLPTKVLDDPREASYKFCVMVLLLNTSPARVALGERERKGEVRLRGDLN
jgi:hypothetical protein